MNGPRSSWDRLRRDHPGLRAQLLTLTLVAIAVVALDGVVDGWVSGLRNGMTPVVGNVLRLTPRHNDGAAFGLLRGAGPWIMVASGLALVALVRLTHRSVTWITLVPIALFFGGGVANLVERVRQSVVLDYLDLGLGTVRWPTFNMSDVAISVGIVLLGFATLVAREPAARAAGLERVAQTDDPWGGLRKGIGPDE